MKNNVSRGARSVQAAQRALAAREQAALDDVERILDAAVRVIERVAPASPRVSDIVAEAGTSNQTFYRYFASKDELVLAVLERGTLRLAAYLEHQMAKAPDAAGAVARWIEGVMAQARRADAARASRATLAQLSSVPGAPSPDRLATLGAARDLLLPPLAALGSAAPDDDANVIAEATFGALGRHIARGTRPGDREVRHLVGFCLRGVGVGSGVGDASPVRRSVSRRRPR